MTKRLVSLSTAAVVTLALTACSSSTQTVDDGVDSHSLVNLAATIWVDPDGCKHWVVDDGVEGYMSPVLNLDGTPDCA
ncbi:MAG: hypothetical protein AAFV19_07475 [Pseudomonadota bacterium]